MRQALLTIVKLTLFALFLVSVELARRFGLLDPSPNLVSRIPLSMALLATTTVIVLAQAVSWPGPRR